MNSNFKFYIPSINPHSFGIHPEQLRLDADPSCMNVGLFRIVAKVSGMFADPLRILTQPLCIFPQLFCILPQPLRMVAQALRMHAYAICMHAHSLWMLAQLLSILAHRLHKVANRLRMLADPLRKDANSICMLAKVICKQILEFWNVYLVKLYTLFRFRKNFEGNGSN